MQRLVTWSAMVLAGCGAGGLEDGAAWLPDAGAGGSPACFSSSECPVGWTCSDFGTCQPPAGGGDAGVPPETEFEFGAPLASSRFVWVAMTDQDALAKIDGETLEVTSIDVGERPRVVATLPGTDIAIALDGVHGAAAVVRPAVAGDDVVLAPTLPRLNALAPAPSGLHAVAYFDLARAIAEAGGVGAVGEVGSFQDVTVIGLAAAGPVTVDLSVGFRPREVEFDADGTTAFVITDDGISIIDLAAAVAGAPTIVPPVPLTTDPLVDATTLEVDVTADGAFAIARAPGAAALRVVRLDGPDRGQGWDVPLPGVPTDLELAPDGRRAYAVVRAAAVLAILDLPIPGEPPAPATLVDLAGVALGSLTLTPDGRHGISYTNASLDERVTVLDLETAGVPRRTLPLQKAVRAVGVSPDGATLLVLHARAPGDPDGATTVEQFVDRRPGYSTVDLATGFAKLQLTRVDPGAFTFVPGVPRAYVSQAGADAAGTVATVDELALDSGVVRTLELGSPPEAIGVLPASGRVYVSQRHGLGRVTFVDVAAGTTRTITGFDLNGQIVD